ncbi:MAG TPA: hypothetical protein PKL30_25555 [Leptospiraceae bacterium]|nr:hypothetical protein [Leptospiraceae bacterium]HMX34707.1 hypothetical protein [Leptospiraceae bacterium]HMZ64872.1 hypothetical protein [Leptospiraceae bacterium]HNK59253.1 hypothetical protein [Leptospiraceae bacterium]HNK94273.1 hypothetical protein [Leptospiraceae bacterium]
MLSPAKINLGLKILFKRPDGYHELISVFLKLNWGDDMEFISLPEQKMSLESIVELTGRQKEDYIAVSEQGNISKNILHKAYVRSLDRNPNLPGVHIKLTKRISPGGGLGGGSTNAASLLKFLFPEETQNPNPDFLQFASGIGADVPFFLGDGHSLVTGIGEKNFTPFSSKHLFMKDSQSFFTLSL